MRRLAFALGLGILLGTFLVPFLSTPSMAGGPPMLTVAQPRITVAESDGSPSSSTAKLVFPAGAVSMSGSTATISFVAAIASNAVTTDTIQTITGAKTFTKNVTLSSTVYAPGASLTSGFKMVTDTLAPDPQAAFFFTREVPGSSNLYLHGTQAGGSLDLSITTQTFLLFGYQSGFSFVNGHENLGVGDFSLFFLQRGRQNAAFGYSAGPQTDEAFFTTFLGNNSTSAGTLDGTALMYATCVGNSCEVARSSSVILGRYVWDNVGIGTTNPTTKLDIVDGVLTVRGSGAGAVIVGVSDGSDAATGNWGQIVSSSTAQAAAVALTTGQSIVVNQITLTAGDWQVSGSISFSGGVITGTLFQGFVGTAAGNNTTGRDLALNTVSLPTAPTAASDVTLALPTYRVSITSTTTYYLKANTLFTVGSATAYGTLAARRVAH